MNAVTSFVAIVSLLLALAAGSGAATPRVGGSCPPFACGTDSNHNETLVRDAAPMK
jgi:hypothetical protein